VAPVKDAKKREAMWERQHELAADKMYSIFFKLGGQFLKVLSYFSFSLFFCGFK
jgi:aarF domain-containing kinase